MSLKEYRKKRTFTITKEPKGTKASARKPSLIFVIHEHHARHLHFDLRLELDGVLKSFAVPKALLKHLRQKDQRLRLRIIPQNMQVSKELSLKVNMALVRLLSGIMELIVQIPLQDVKRIKPLYASNLNKVLFISICRVLSQKENTFSQD